MPFTVQFRMGDDDWHDPLDYDDCDTVADVLMQLLADWAAGEADLHGTFAFLTNHGHDFGVADDAMGTDADLLARAGEVVLDLCAESEAITQEYLIAIGDRVLIAEMEIIDGEDTSSTEELQDSDDDDDD